MGQMDDATRVGTGQRGAGTIMSLSDQIAVALAAAISRGDYKPGERIHEVTVSTVFGVSRGPVREALRILDKQGLVSIQPRRGARVTDPSVDEVDHIFEIRAVLLGLAARTVAEHGDAEVLAELRRRVRGLKDGVGSDDPDGYVDKVQNFNLYLCAASGNALLETMVRSLFLQSLRYARLGLSTEARRRRSVANWQHLVDCISKRDAQGAEASARLLVTSSRDMAVKLLTKGAASY